MLKRNTSGLKKNALKKRELAHQRAEEGIKTLLETGRSINFGTVAEIAGVSRTWLYNQPEIRVKIEKYRDKQTKKTHHSQEQKTLDQKKKSKIKDLKEHILRLKTENSGLRTQIKQLDDSGLLDIVEMQQKEIEDLTKQNRRLMKLLTETRTEIECLKDKKNTNNQS